MAVFIDPFTDTGFKIIFGKENVSNEILVHFLNALFKDQPGFDRIVSVKYPNTERTREWVEGKTIVYDVYCETERGHRFIVEMQKNPQEKFLDRAVYYVSRSVAEQGYKGKLDKDDKGKDYWKYDLLPVVGVFFSNFYIKGLERKPVVRGILSDVDTGKPISFSTRYAFIQLPAFRIVKEEDCHTDFDRWIYSLKNMHDMETMPFTSHNDIFRRLAKVGSVANLTPEERMQYEYDLKKARDYNAEMSYARKLAMEEGREEGLAKGKAEGLAKGLAKGKAEGLAKGLAKGKAEGLAKGLEQGRAEGRAEGFYEVAKKMLLSGYDWQQITDVTGLTEKDLS